MSREIFTEGVDNLVEGCREWAWILWFGAPLFFSNLLDYERGDVLRRGLARPVSQVSGIARSIIVHAINGVTHGLSPLWLSNVHIPLPMPALSSRGDGVKEPIAFLCLMESNTAIDFSICHHSPPLA